MQQSVSELLGRLRAEGLATEAHTPLVRSALIAGANDDMPVYLRVVTGIGAWIAAVLLLVFFVELVTDEGANTIIGVVVIVIAVLVRLASGGEFLRQASVAASFAGQGLLVYGLGRVTNDQGTPALVALFVSLVLILLMRDRFHRFLSATISVVAMAMLLDAVHVPGFLDVTALMVAGAIAGAWRINMGGRSDETDELLVPVGYGLVIALFGLMLFSAFFATPSGAYHEEPHLGVATTSGIALLLDVLARTIFREHYASGDNRAGIAIFGGIAVFAAVTMDSPGIITGVAVLVLGFDRRNLLLVEMGTAFLLVFGAAYYRGLDLTLLQKAGILAASGAVCLAARALLGARRAMPSRSTR